MKVGYRDKIWHKNCVAMGLAAGFVEPLEATALLLVEASAKLLADKIPCFKNEMNYAQKSFNQISQYGWDRVIDFIKLHYLLSNRTDTKFWRDNQDPKTVPESLSDKLNHWKNNLPTTSDFFSQYEVFRLENYQYVLYGMEFNTDINSVEQRYTEKKAAINVVKNIQDQIKIVPQHLDSHRTLIDKIKEFGLNKI
jgi:tryptophan halogenase